MADLKLMETSLISSMDTKFAEMRELITQLASGKVPKETTPLDDSASSHDGETEEGKEEKKGVEDKDTDPKKSSTSTATPEGGKPVPWGSLCVLSRPTYPSYSHKPFGSTS